MTLQADDQNNALSADERAVHGLFAQWMATWNRRRADELAALFGEDGNAVGFDGSQLDGRERIEEQIGQVFTDHETGRYVGVVREVRFLATGVALLRGVVGMIPHGQSELNPNVNAIVSLVAVRQGEGDGWRVALLQNTPAQFHGRPELAAALTAELRRLV